ncbi:cell division protein ZipA [Canicola haemoglobinophilus]|uniref:Cell division protein ZipA n=1 Tax=Canicola haemoglobinophilus TaxID=733 RepID=A0AB38HDK3_9PAST|nr:cell division protein ZipA [Canicola haemoglobinophilus]STO54754.1 cell division protein ZipA [Canicola haemoglobinophilus]STO69674.1 cell division protein ZipA [Canicola haemoglobinophilus]
MDLNTILIILGVVALIVLVVHGIWSNRREKSQYFENSETFTRESRIREPQENQQYQTVSKTQQPPQMDNDYYPPKQDSHIRSEQPFYDYNEQSAIQQDIQSVDQIKISLPDSEPAYVMREDLSPKPNDYASMSIEELEKSIDLNEGINSSSQRLRQELAEISGQSSTNKVELEKNTNIHNESAVVSVEEMPKTEPQVAEKPKPVNPSFVMLYVVASENRGFNGLQLTKTLDELGFIFGKKQIYHRHVDLSITSPVLFSVANIEQPGTFDLANIADFYTVGIALFMQLPSYGNATANLRMMIRAAKTIAQDLGGVVVTDQQEVFDDQAERDYLARVA